ncbi:MAG: thioredoxin domain-containing protein [Bacteroidaceae bacterium]|nr:thioredoxin domain-containing protein [Bacteroidaceae bacterium]
MKYLVQIFLATVLFASYAQTASAQQTVIVKSIDSTLVSDAIFKALVAPYKGKPVLVDFWATWCGPCRAAMKTIQPVKDELWGKVSFLYVTGPSSPKETWEQMKDEIHGVHYYVTKAQYSALLAQFESQGIPTYVIVDKDGNVTGKYIGYPGNEVIKTALQQ